MNLPNSHLPAPQELETGSLRIVRHDFNRWRCWNVANNLNPHHNYQSRQKLAQIANKYPQHRARSVIN